MLIEILKIIGGLIALIFGGDLLLRSAVAASNKFKISKIVIGMTVVSFATSLPELIVSVRSATLGYPDLALGNIVGYNIANLGFVLAIGINKVLFFKYSGLILNISDFLIPVSKAISR